MLALIRDGQRQQAIFAATDDTTVDGVYGFFFDGGKGHARIGRIVSYSPAERTVLRDVEAVYAGDLSKARRGWWSGAVHPDPAAVGIPHEEVMIDVDRGQAPAWLVRAGGTARTWAVMVHGRGATRQEALRALDEGGERFEASLAEAFAAGGGRLTHPYFGQVDAIRSLRFVAVHLEHHRRQIDRVPRG